MTESLLYRILDGKIEYEEGYIRDPSLSIKKAGRKVYEECLKFYDDDIIDSKALNKMMIVYGLWSQEKEKRLEALPMLVDNQKVEYYRNFFIPPAKNKNKNAISLYNKELKDLIDIKYKYQYMTLEGIAVSAMWTEMIGLMYKGKNKLGALTFYNKNAINEHDIRDLALSNEWMSYCALTKSPHKSPLKMTDYQRQLYSWTNVYRNVRSHPDFPGDHVLTDHDAFDGWMILTNRKEKAEKSNKVTFDKLKPNTRNVFIAPESVEDFHNIMALNTPEALQKIKSGEQ